MKVAKVIAMVVSALGLIFVFGSVGNLDYMEACGMAVRDYDVFTEFAKAWCGLLIFSAGAAFAWLATRYEEWKDSGDISERRNKS